MDVFIHIPPGMDVDLEEIEDGLDEAIGELGEVAGGAISATGTVIDLDVEDDVDPAQLAGVLRSVLKGMGIAVSRIDIGGASWS